MSEFRADPLFGSVCLVSSERASRPHRLRSLEDPEPSGPCPMCPGNEGLCPPEISRKEGMAGRWQSRAFPNRYPAVTLEAELDLGHIGKLMPYSDAQPGFGAHEVVVDSPSHSVPFWAQDPKEATLTLELVRSRIAELYKDQRISYVQAFKNHRAGSGASLDHPHFQLIGLPFVPEPISRLWALKRCGVCDFLKWEGSEKGGAKERSPRLLAETAKFIAYADYAPTFSHQFSILPKKHMPAFDQAGAVDLEELSQLCSMVIGRFQRLLGDLALNFVIYGAPNSDAFAAVAAGAPLPSGNSAKGGEDSQLGVRPSDAAWKFAPGVHWFIRAFPRIGSQGGFEIASTIPIIQVTPEDSARAFREKGI